jgi:hypothetical protein
VRVDELVLLSVGSAGEDGVEGRTRIQKIVYFLAERLGINARFSPYFYGPYSELVAQSLASLVVRRLVTESAESFSTPGPFEGRAYTYALTEQGAEAIRALKKERPGECHAALEALGQLLADDPSTRALAVASKLYVIVRRSPRPVPVEALQRRAKGLGWRIGDSDVADGVTFLVEQRLLEEVDT